MNARSGLLLAGLVACGAAGPARAVQALGAVDGTRPDAVVDLATREGVALLGGAWRYSDAEIVEVAHRLPGPDLRATGAPNRTHDIAPRAGTVDFDDSTWEIVDPTALERRRSGGRLAFGWYRFQFTVPAKIGKLDTRGATLVLEIVVDDYAEVWVDGRLPLVLGQTGGAVVGGFNAPNRVLLTRDAQPGQQLHLAVFAMNAPVSSPPPNYLWVRSATLEVYDRSHARTARDAAFERVRVDPALDSIVSPEAKLEQLASGFLFTEGPVWVPDGYLLFSDPNANRIYRYDPLGAVSVFRVKSGYAGADIGEYAQPGSNGLALDPQGRLTICEHGNRRVTRLEPNGALTVLADRYAGKRLNSPNDLAYRSDGSLYFTDPPFGLPRFGDDPRRELDFSGVFLLALDGRLQLVSRDLAGPNGLAFSPDEKFLYVTNWDPARKVVLRYEVQPDGSLADGRVWFDMGRAPEAEALDGIKVDRAGNLFVSGPGGLWILAPDGRHLGTLRLPELPANFAWGDSARTTLYLTARTGLYRLILGSAP
ncbi:MAG TPA: SMP-30/gluconolactonase/LRE family protein [Candidatus Polarisedimenticolaceae bacterium]|nr:SMP-30/gluconolactonase/LRE family protein [Candidatus Polarisedimenticolaceae bacterium]